MCFGVSAGKFLGFIIHEKGIEIDPKRVEAMKKVEAPTMQEGFTEVLGQGKFLEKVYI